MLLITKWNPGCLSARVSRLGRQTTSKGVSKIDRVSYLRGRRRGDPVKTSDIGTQDSYNLHSPPRALQLRGSSTQMNLYASFGRSELWSWTHRLARLQGYWGLCGFKELGRLLLPCPSCSPCSVASAAITCPVPQAVGSI